MQRCYTLNAVVVFSMLILFSCGPNVPREVKQALRQAEGNRPELEKVISHYQQLGDTLKLKAAYFLIANMTNKYSVVHPATASAYSFLNANMSKYDRRKENYDIQKVKIDSIKTKQSTPLDIFLDITTIKSEFLIENIDLAFEAWKNPWSKQFSFEQFCENILPYRMQHEPLSNWRKVLYDEYISSIDTLQDVADVHRVVMVLNSAIAKRFYLYEDYQLTSPSVISLNAKGVGGCNEKYQLAVAVFRTFGIPSAIDFSPQLTYEFKGHGWVVYWDSTNNINPIDAGDAQRPKNNKHVGKYLPVKNGKATSVYRYTYSIHKQSLQYLKKKMTKPRVFEEASIANVTHEYDFPQQTITFDLNRKLGKQKVLYLSTFTYRQQLNAVNWAIPQGKQVRFSNMGNEGVYILAAYDRDSLHAVSNPVLVRDSGKVEVLFSQVGKTQDIVLTRKCNISLQMREFARRMVGTVFEGSNTPNFKNPTVLYTITEMPEFLVEQAVSNGGKYRYVRYRSPQAEVKVAELQFFEKDESGVDHKLSGNVISSIAPKDTAESNPEYALDGNIRTNFNAPQGSWVGLDLGYAAQISKVAYLPRNSWNVIEPGNRYELLYYDNGWHSLGVKRATEQYLKYSNVPIGALLVLKNLTQGKEERIFTYENGKQVWW